MDSDQRLQRMAGSLRAVLKPRDLIDELLARRVLTKGEYEEINAVTLNRGNMEGNRCLIRHMLIGKSTRQVDDFLKVILEIQREEVLGIIREKIRPVSSDLHGGDERSPLAIETFPIEISEPLAALAASGNDVGPSLGGSGPRRITQGARVGGSVQETGSANGVLDTHRPHERFPQASSNPPDVTGLDVAVTDGVIVDLARHLQTREKITRVGSTLGFDMCDIEGWFSPSGKTPYRTAVTMLTKWREGGGTPHRVARRIIYTLVLAIRKAGFEDIARKDWTRAPCFPSLTDRYGAVGKLSDPLCAILARKLPGFCVYIQLGNALGFSLNELEGIEHRLSDMTPFQTFYRLLVEWCAGTGNKTQPRTIGMLAAALEYVEKGVLAQELLTKHSEWVCLE